MALFQEQQAAKQCSRGQKSCDCSGCFGGWLSAGEGGRKLGWVLEVFVAGVQPRAAPVRPVPFVLGAGLTQGRLTGTGQRRAAPAAGSSFAHLPEAGWNCCRCALPSDSELRG